MSQQVVNLKAIVEEKGFPISAKARDFKLIVDEPKELGGTDKGPNPLEYLLIAEASCITVTIRSLAHRNKIPIETITIEATSEFNVSDFLKGERSSIKEIKLNIKVKSPRSYNEIMEIVNRAEKICPVTNTLSSKITINLIVEK